MGHQHRSTACRQEVVLRSREKPCTRRNASPAMATEEPARPTIGWWAGKGRFPATSPRSKPSEASGPMLRLSAAGHAVQRVEVTDQRRDLCSGCLYFEPQRHYRGRRYDGRSDAAKSKNAKPGRLRDIFAGKMKRASGFFPIPRDHAQPQDREGARPPNSRPVAALADEVIE